jgi:hypothetical protein
MTIHLLRTRSHLKVLGLALLGTLAGCENSDTDLTGTFSEVGTSAYGVAAGTPLAVEGDWLAFLADEAASGGTDMNGDGGLPLDSVAVVVNVDSKEETNLGVAAKELFWVGSELYLVVDEVFDEHDHGGTVGITDLVLMHWSEGMAQPAFVADLDRASVPSALAVGETVFYAGTGTPAGAGDSSLVAIDVNFPATSRPVFTQDMDGPLTPRLVGEQDGLVLCALDETVDARDLNGDGTATDTHVLALLDGTGFADAGGYTLSLRSTGLAISGADSPYRAVTQGVGDWLLGFLVDESAQEQNFNVFDGSASIPGIWQAAACVANSDSDTDDRVLHAIRFAAWDADTVTNPPYNTGIAGTDRVLIVGDAIATIALETDENDCVFNGDGDFDDRILRWIRMDGGVFGSTGGPVTSVQDLIALDPGLAGPAMSVAEVDGVFVVQCDELEDGRDHDGDAPNERDLLAWLDPQDTAAPGWQFNHSSTGSSWATAIWMGELPGRTRLGIAYAESSNGVDLNGDGDELDSVPTYADLIPGSPGRLSFPGASLALEPANAGISLANGWGYFRVSELQHGSDINVNGQADDILLFRVNLGNGSLVNMGALNTLARPSIETEPDGLSGAGAFLFDETIIGVNVSADTDANDLVPRFFLLP